MHGSQCHRLSMNNSPDPTAPLVPRWPPWALPAKPPELARTGTPRDGATGRTLPSCQGLFPPLVLSGAFPAHPLACLLLELVTSMVGLCWSLGPCLLPEQVLAVSPPLVAGLGQPHAFLAGLGSLGRALQAAASLSLCIKMNV